MKVMHFDSQEARLAFLNGEYEEIVPVKAEKKEKEKKKPAKRKESEDEVQAE